jgi:adenylate kinase
MPNFIILGPQGSGKGTHGEFIANLYNIPLISTGEIFRREIREETELGKKVKEYVEQGKLVPDEIVIEVLKKRIAQEDCKNGFILDGFPRTLEQAKALDEIAKIDLVIYLDVTKETIIERLSGRRTCKQCGAIYHIKFIPPKEEGKCDKCGGELYQREDDKPEIIEERLKNFEELTKPLLDYYEAKGILRKVDGNGEREEVDGRIKELLKNEGLLNE